MSLCSRVPERVTRQRPLNPPPPEPPAGGPEDIPAGAAGDGPRQGVRRKHVQPARLDILLFLTVSLSHPQEGLKAYQQVPLAAGLGKAYGENTSTPPKGRRAGVLMHPTSLPGPYGIGTIGAEAHAFVDWLATAGMQVITAGIGMASTTLHNGATDGANGGLEGLVMPCPF